MNIITEYEDYDGLGLADLVKRKEVTPLELLETAIARTELYNPQINAIVTKMYELARANIAKGLPQGTFAGLPFLLKDLGTLYEGVPTTQGSRFYKSFIPDHDSTVVQRFKEAGLVIFGKTNTPEFGLSYTTEPQFFGPSRNPWNLGLTPGGSSGGAAAAVAARIIPVAHASDGGGSIRVPASCCGLFGLKPTRARVSMGPDIGEGWSGLGSSHVISKTVRDSAAMLDVIAGQAPGDPYFAPPGPASFLETVSQAPKPLKIAFFTQHPVSGFTVDDACIKGVEQAIKLCSELGHHIEEAKPEYSYDRLYEVFHVIVAANTKTFLQFWAELSSRALAESELEPLTWAIAQSANNYSASDYARALFVMHNQSRRIAQFFLDYDVLLTPTLAKPPIPIGKLTGISGNLQEFNMESQAFSPFAWLYNMTGQPAMSVPLYWTRDNIPIGVQFVGRFGDEATLFNLAAQLEQAQPWSQRKPTLLK